MSDTRQTARSGSDNNMTTAHQVATLQTLFPNAPVFLIEAVVSASRGNMETAVQLLLSLAGPPTNSPQGNAVCGPPPHPPPARNTTNGPATRTAVANPPPPPPPAVQMPAYPPFYGAPPPPPAFPGTGVLDVSSLLLQVEKQRQEIEMLRILLQQSHTPPTTPPTPLIPTPQITSTQTLHVNTMPPPPPALSTANTASTLGTSATPATASSALHNSATNPDPGSQSWLSRMVYAPVRTFEQCRDRIEQLTVVQQFLLNRVHPPSASTSTSSSTLPHSKRS
ncbi:hypothetical protein Pelo_5947 [Pelomyxa schiedti]|nr:hypothetical protein Pelo_5947 [Pelomyxa schiedti]